MIYADDQKYGLLPDGTGDNTVPLQKLLDHASATQQGIMLPAGVYRTGTVYGLSGLSMIGESRATTKLLLHPAADANAAMFNLSDTSDATVRGICFDGDGRGPREGDALVAVYGTKRARIIDCMVCAVPYIGLAIGYGAADTLVQGCAFIFTGKSEVTSEGGAAVWIGGSEDRPVQKTVIDRCLFEHLQWSAIYSCPQFSPASDTTISNNTVRHVMESALFLYGFPRLRVIGNTIEDVRCKNISACGIESGGYATITGNTIRRTQANSISLQQPIDCYVSANECTASDDAAISILSVAFDPETMRKIGAPRNAQVIGNMLDSSATARIRFAGQDGATKASSIIIAGNTGLAADGGLDLDTQFMGANFFVDRNLIGGKI